jgi:hypothetical protein
VGASRGPELLPCNGPADDYRLSYNELMRPMLDRELLTCVTAAPVTMPQVDLQPVAGTNNESENRGLARTRLLFRFRWLDGLWACREQARGFIAGNAAEKPFVPAPCSIALAPAEASIDLRGCRVEQMSGLILAPQLVQGHRLK